MKILMVRFFKTPSFMLLALSNQGIDPMDSSQKPPTFCLEKRQNAVFAVFSDNA